MAPIRAIHGLFYCDDSDGGSGPGFGQINLYVGDSRMLHFGLNWQGCLRWVVTPGNEIILKNRCHRIELINPPPRCKIELVLTMGLEPVAKMAEYLWYKKAKLVQVERYDL